MTSPAKPKRRRREKMLPVRLHQEFFDWLQEAAEKHGISISDLLRDGARMYVESLEQKGGPGKEEECKRSASRIRKDQS